MRSLFPALTVLALVVAAAPRADAQTGTISGTITNSVTGAPVAGATVRLWLEGTSTSARPTTAADGSYSSALTPGDYLVSASVTGYVEEYYDNIPCWKGSCSFDNAIRLHVTAGATLVANMALDPVAAIRGRVTDATTGAPLTGIAITVFGDPPIVQGTTSTIATGEYSIELLAGTYYVRTGTTYDRSGVAGHVSQLFSGIPCAAADCRVTNGTAITLAYGQSATADFALALESSISGRVRRADGSAVWGAVVEVFNAATSSSGSVSTDSTGWYGVAGLPAGSYFVRAGPSSSSPYAFPYVVYGGDECLAPGAWPDCRITSGTPVVVPSATAITGIDFTFRLPGSISGTVRGVSAAPLQSVFVDAYLGETFVASAQTDGLGHYTLGALPPGAYRLRTSMNELWTPGGYMNEWYSDVCVGCPGTPQLVTVTSGGAIDAIDFDLAVGGVVTGRVTCTDLQGFGWMIGPGLSAYNASGQLVQSSGVGCPATAAEYVIRGLPTGTYYLLARDAVFYPTLPRPSGGTIIDELYDNIVCVTADCDVRRGTPVRVTAGATTAGVNFDLQTGASIARSGLSSDPAMRIYDARGIEVTPAVRFSSWGFRYEAVGLPPGTYYVRFGTELYNGVDCAVCPATMGTPIVVRTPQDWITLPASTGAEAGQVISGTVRDAADNTPLSTVTVQIYSSSGELAASAVSDAFGRFTAPPPPSSKWDPVRTLPAGTYYARTSNTRGYVDQLYGRADCAACPLTSGTPIVIAAGSDVTGLDFHLAAGAAVRGTVTDGAGVPIMGASVSVFDGSGQLTGRATSSLTGIYETTVLAGSYYVRTDPLSGRVMKLYSNLACPSGTCGVTAGTPVTTSRAMPASGIDFGLPACSAVALSPNILASGAVGDPYRQRFTASGGTTPHGFVFVDGLLPPGLTLDSSTGVLSGTPSLTGHYSFRAGAVDASGCAAVNTYAVDVTTCSFVLTPSSATVPSAGGTVELMIIDGCGDRTVTSDAAWARQDTAASTTTRVVLTVDANSIGGARVGYVSIGRRVFTLRQGGATSQPPFGAVDLPIDGGVVSGSMAAGGWALDDLEVARVRIYRDPVGTEGTGRVYLGEAVFVRGARPDVAALYPLTPLSDRAGWGFLILTNMLPNQGNGIFRIHAYAEDVEGHEVLLGSRTIIAANLSATLPFGAIDTPGQGQTIGGTTFVNFGWALTPQPKSIPFDGSTIRMLIDGAPVGTVSYNYFRSDVSSLFPGLANSGGPVGYRTIDTTALAEGMHTISWVVTDDAGASTEIGSRYFTASNSSDAQPASLRAFARRQPAAVPLGTIEGADLHRRVASLADLPASESGDRQIAIAPTDRLELALGSDAGQACAGTWAAYLDVDGELRELPTGASLDPAGTFYWQPGAAFGGTFEFVFIRTDCAGMKTRAAVTVTLGR